MGGRGSFSGLIATIDDVLGGREGSDRSKVKEIDPKKFGSLEDTENRIRKLRREVLVVYDHQGCAIKAYQGNQTSVAFPDTEAKKWRGLTVTHNHPKGREGFGGTFSFADMRNATVYKFGQLRAVASGQGEKNYILMAGKKARPMALNRRIAHDIPQLKDKMKNEVIKTKQEYQAGQFKNYGHALHVARQRSVGVLNSYYKNTAEQYGYVYRTQK